MYCRNVVQFLGVSIWIALQVGCGVRYPQVRLAELIPPKDPPRQEAISVPILTYHRFSSTGTDTTTIGDSTFEDQLRFLKTHGYTVISLRALVDRIRGQGTPLPPRPIVITADDGHKSVYTDMLPIIRRYGIPVTLFIYPSAISNASYAMSWDQLKELQSTGLFDIQSHTYWHPNFITEQKRLSPAQYQQFAVTQLTKSKEILDARLQKKVDLLAWPFGIHDDNLANEAKEAGYVAGFALGNKPAVMKDSIMALPRFMITEEDKGAAFERLLRPSRATSDPVYSGTATDALTGGAIPNATITGGKIVVHADSLGSFRIAATGNLLRVRAPGYLRRDITASGPNPIPISLTPFKPKALYLSFYGIGSTVLRDSALRLADDTEINALVIDVKGDRGMIAFRMSSPLAEEVGAQKTITIRDAPELIASLQEKGIYTIARIVVFKDDPLARSRPDLAVKSAGGEIWHDSEHLAWTDPFKAEVWDYNIDVAVAAAAAGFDEIQFDYLRFPDSPGLHFAQPNTQEQRLAAITGSLKRARERLIPYNVYIAADVFGYVCWNLNDTSIGQRLEELSPEVDYISPMLYPSGFQSGIPGHSNPVTNAYAIVSLSLKEAQRRNGFTPIRFRPWLQAFKDYAFDRRIFGSDEIRQQIDAAEEFGADGWMLWNPHNTYSEAGLKPRVSTTR